jgi:Domain of unknown function (DUF3883)
MNEVVDTALDRTALEALLAERALGADALDTSKIQSVREEMEKASARRLQPHFISSFFLEGFSWLGGKSKERESGRYELTHVPGAIRQRARDMGLHPTLVPEYERVVFDKALINPPGHVLAEFVCPGHPLLDATIDLLMERHRDLLRRGAVLVDATDLGTDPRVLVMLEHTITDARMLSDGRPQITSRRMAFVELRPDGSSTPAGPAPYLDYAPATNAEIAAVVDALKASWLTGGLEDRAVSYAIADLAREHLDEVRKRTESRVVKTVAAVKSRLTHEIAYWDRRADEAAAKEQTGKSPGELNSTRWRQRANDLSERLEHRLAELELERRVTSLVPVVVGGALVIPVGLLVAARVRQPLEHSADPAARTRVEQLAMDAVMAAERAMGNDPVDVSGDNVGYDILSRTPSGLRFVEVKGRAEGATTVTVTRNEIQTCLNEPDKYLLAVVNVADDRAAEPTYLAAPFRDDVPFAATSVNFSIRDLLAHPELPPAPVSLIAARSEHGSLEEVLAAYDAELREMSTAAISAPVADREEARSRLLDAHESAKGLWASYAPIAGKFGQRIEAGQGRALFFNALADVATARWGEPPEPIASAVDWQRASEWVDSSRDTLLFDWVADRLARDAERVRSGSRAVLGQGTQAAQQRHE